LRWNVPQRPDLTALIAEHGNCAAIPSDAWTTYDAAVAKWRAARIAQLRDLQAANGYRAMARKPAPKARRAGR
jgi:hypothetical protein